MDPDALLQLIQSRRAVFPREYTGDAISQDTLDRLFTLANWAPSHRRTEPWRFIVVRDEARDRLGIYMANRYKQTAGDEAFSLAKYNKTRQKPTQASVVIAVVMQRDPQERVPHWEEVAATAMAVQNLWLGVTALGLAGYWSTPKTMVEDRAFLGLRPGEECLGLFYLGTAEPATRNSSRGPAENKVRYLDA